MKQAASSGQSRHSIDIDADARFKFDCVQAVSDHFCLPTSLTKQAASSGQSCHSIDLDAGARDQLDSVQAVSGHFAFQLA